MLPPHDSRDPATLNESRDGVDATSPAAGPLTPPLSAQAFLREASRLLAEARTQGQSIALLLFVRRWKEEELRRFGEPVGDGLIRRAQEALKVGSRSSDLFGHYEDADFALLLPGATEEAATHCARRLFESLSMEGVSLNGATLPLEVTIGGAIARKGEELHDLAKRALEAIKKGREHKEPTILV